MSIWQEVSFWRKVVALLTFGISLIWDKEKE